MLLVKSTIFPGEIPHFTGENDVLASMKALARATAWCRSCWKRCTSRSREVSAVSAWGNGWVWGKIENPLCKMGVVWRNHEIAWIIPTKRPPTVLQRTRRRDAGVDSASSFCEYLLKRSCARSPWQDLCRLLQKSCARDPVYIESLRQDLCGKSLYKISLRGLYEKSLDKIDLGDWDLYTISISLIPHRWENSPSLTLAGWESPLRANPSKAAQSLGKRHSERSPQRSSMCQEAKRAKKRELGIG